MYFFGCSCLYYRGQQSSGLGADPFQRIVRIDLATGQRNLSVPRACSALGKPTGKSNEEIFLVIVCTSSAVAGQVVLFLLECSLSPRSHYRIDQIEGDTIIITVANTLPPAKDAQIRAELATIAGVSIQ
jgi:hypothetical protein